MKNGIRFGWAETDITPRQKIALAGQFYERATTEVETPITVTALAIDTGDEQTVLCSCDIAHVTEELTAAARARMTGEGLDPDKVIVGCVHIHNAYTYRDRGPFKHMPRSSLQVIRRYMPADCTYIPQVTSDDCMDPDDAFEYLADAIAKTVNEAWANRREGGYAAGFGRAAVGMNRRVCYSDDTAKMWGDADMSTFTELEGGNDSGIEMLFIYDKTEKLTGVVAVTACPAQVMEHRSVVSSDYWGKVKILLRQKYGDDLFLLPFCAPAGDQCPRDLIRWVQPKEPLKDPNIIRPAPKRRDADPSMFDVEGTRVIGRRIFTEIEAAMENVAKIHTEAVHKHVPMHVKLPLRRVTERDRAEAERYLTEFFKGKKELNYKDSAALHVYAGTLQRYEAQAHYGTVDVEVHAVRFGDVAFGTDPFELFLNYGNRIRARSAAAQTFLIQLANGSLGYLPTEAAERHGHYSAYVSSGYVGHEGGDLLVDVTLDGINRLFEE